MPEKLTGADVQELEALEELRKSMGWRILRNLLNKHRIYCVEKSQQHLRKHEDRKAGEWLARGDTPTRLINLVQERINDLTKRSQEGE